MTALPYPLRTRRGRRWRSFLGFMAIVAIAAGAWPVDAQRPREEDRARLVQLYRETDGANWRNNRNWGTAEPTSRWYGLSTFVPTHNDPTTAAERHVTGIELPRNNLSGSLRLVDFDGMHYLEHVDLSGNALDGPVPRFRARPLSPLPPEAPDLPPHLDYLDLSDNDLSSGLPFLAMPLSLDHLDLSNNALSGHVAGLVGRPPPYSQDAPADLWYLDFSHNALAGFSPGVFNAMPNLWHVNVSHNELTGQIPAELGDLINLRVLDLSHNGKFGEAGLFDDGLTGPVPAELGRLTHLEILNLDHNELTGPIPAELGRLTHLEILNLGHNELTGSIPAELGRLTRLWRLDLGFNELTGPIPETLTHLDRLAYFYMGGTDACVPAGEAFEAWRAGIESRGTFVGSPCAVEAAERAILEAFYDATGGDDWTNNSNWKTDAPLREWYGVRMSSRGRVLGLELGGNGLTGSIPPALAGLERLARLNLRGNDLTGAIPGELGGLANLRWLHLDYNWGLSGPLPSSVQLAPLEELGIFVTQACAPAGWQDWLTTIDFDGGLCWMGGDVTVDLAVVYTPAAREAAGGAAAIAAEIDLMIAETNQAYDASEVRHRLALVGRSEVSYIETGNSAVDVGRLAQASDGYMDEVHAMRDGVGADLVHLVVAEADLGGRAFLGGAFSLGKRCCLAHELGHNMGIAHDRYEEDKAGAEGRPWAVALRPHPAYGYVNQRAFEVGAPPSSCWVTIMAYFTQCEDAGLDPRGRFRFSNPRQSHDGDSLGVPYGAGGSRLTGPADAAAVLDATGPAVALWRDRPVGANQPPVAADTLPDRVLTLHGTVEVDASLAFVDPDGDALRHTVSSSAPNVVTVLAAGARVTLTGVNEGAATIRVTATDSGGLSATQSFTVAVTPPSNGPPEPVVALPPLTMELDDGPAAVDLSGAFLDPDGDELTYAAATSAPAVAVVSVTGSVVTVTPIGTGMATVGVTATDVDGSNTPATQSFTVTVVAPFTDDPIVPGETPVRAVHFTELRSRIDGLRVRGGLPEYGWTDPVLTAGVTPVRLAHLLDLRSALAAAYSAAGRASPSWTDASPGRATPIRAVHLMELRAAVTALE